MKKTQVKSRLALLKMERVGSPRTQTSSAIDVVSRVTLQRIAQLQPQSLMRPAMPSRSSSRVHPVSNQVVKKALEEVFNCSVSIY